jgi:carboxyvinyl-carboxyphosphonate phosphorylmutase
MDKRTTLLRRLLEEPEVIVAPGAADPMTARLVEQAGFPAVYMTGSGTSLARYGFPDVGLVTLTEMVENARTIARAVRIPVIADADTGYGNVLNVRRTVREYEAAGVAAIHLEDQVFPKKCGHLAGKRVIPQAEMVQKVRAACEARTDPDFVIIARCDALAAAGLAEALDRGHAYAAAGADVVFIESPRTMAEIEAIGRGFTVPLLYNMSTSGKSPALSAEELRRLGYRLMILPNFTTMAAIKAIREVLAEIKRTGSAANLGDRCATFREFMELAGLPEIQEAEVRYGLPEDARTSV